MINELKNIIVYLFLGFVISFISRELNSDFLNEFYSNHLISILITLLAINTATSSIVLTKLKEIADKNGFDFQKSFDALKNAIIEQVVLIGIAFICSILSESKIIMEKLNYQEIIFLTLKSAIFIYAVDILRDTAKSIFVIIKK